jgi:hypothetical protein
MINIDDVDVNLGVCPSCKMPVHFRKTKKKIYLCVHYVEKKHNNILMEKFYLQKLNLI